MPASLPDKHPAAPHASQTSVDALWTHQVQEQQLLHQVVLAGQHVAHNGDEEGGELLARQDGGNCLLHCVHLGILIARLQRLPNLILGDLHVDGQQWAGTRGGPASLVAAAEVGTGAWRSARAPHRRRHCNCCHFLWPHTLPDHIAAELLTSASTVASLLVGAVQAVRIADRRAC